MKFSLWLNRENLAKAGKNYALADELREQIIQAGWEIKDTKEGYELTFPELTVGNDSISLFHMLFKGL